AGEVAQVLLDFGADVKDRDNVGTTPLHEAALKGRAGAARVLLHAGADGDVRNDAGDT
ncbi:hypothetical protein T484DRAFT_1552020, partial [Baffinella frigidus]